MVVGDEEIQYQSHRTRHIHEVTSQFDVPTSLTPGPIWTPVVFSLCGLYERGQKFDQPPSRETSSYLSRWYKCRDPVRVGILCRQRRAEQRNRLPDELQKQLEVVVLFNLSTTTVSRLEFLPLV